MLNCKRIFWLSVATIFVFGIGEGQARAKVDVVATVPTLAALVEAVGGDHVRVTSMALATQDPHFVDAKPSLVLQLNKADLLVAVGLDLEVGWLPTLQTGARNRKIQRGATGYLECALYARIVDVPRQKVDRSMGDIHPGGNPHYLYDPRGALGCAYGIMSRLATIDPKHAADYRRNLAYFKHRLEKKTTRWKQQLAAHRGAKVVTYHRSWSYLLDWVGLDKVAEIEPKPGIAPSARHIAKVIGVARQAKVKTILLESFYPSRTAKLIASKVGASLTIVPSGPDLAAGQSYFDYMDGMVERLKAGLQ